MKSTNIGVLAVLSFGFLSCAAIPSQPQPKENEVTILHGGTIYTMDNRQARAEAVVITNGRISKVGDSATILAQYKDRDVRRINLKGNTVVPGLTDAHMHLFSLGRATFFIDLVGTQSKEEIAKKVAEAVKTAKPGEWIRGRGWDQNDWGPSNNTFPNAQDLDAVSPNNPVALTRVDGHALWVNTAGLKAANITDQTSDVEGGSIQRSAGKATGIFIDNAMGLVRKTIPGFTKAQLKESVLRAQAMCLRSGLSQVHDMGMSAEQLSILRELKREGQLKLRVYVMLDGSSEQLETLFAQKPQFPETHEDLLTVRGVKFFVDGALGSRGAALFEDYDDDPKNKGLILTPLGELEKKIRMAKKYGFQVAIHAIGDRGNQSVLDLYEKIYGENAIDFRPRVEHAQVLSEQDIPRFSHLGVIASMQPTHATSDMPWAEKRVGPKRIEGAYAWRSLMTANATIAAGSDAPVESIDPRLGLYSAVSRQDHAGLPAGGWRPQERMTGAEAIAAFTKNAAWAGFRENDLGQIREGFLADLTVFDIDPVNAPAEALLKAQVQMTIVAGKIAYTIQTP